MAVGLDNLNLLSDEEFAAVQDVVKNEKKISMAASDQKPKLNLNELTFEAYMRWMDAQGYRTGYTYKVPDLFTSQAKTFPESMVPPQTTSDRVNPYQALYELKGPSMSRGNTHRNRFNWLNNPVQATQYKKEFLEKNKPQLKVCIFIQICIFKLLKN